MKRIKKVLITLFYISLIIALFAYRETITNYIIENFIYSKNITSYNKNDYTRQDNFEYVKFTNEFIVHSAKELLNVVYTVIDSGINEFTFYCDKNYTNCQNDIESISGNTDYFTIINNFVHPFNSYNKLYISTNTVGKITISLEKLYSEDEINKIMAYIYTFESKMITNTMNDKDKIKAFHDYVINDTKYDSEKANQMKNNIYSRNENQSHKASGIVENHLALCSGYTDLMAIYLNYIGIKNFKISNDSHIWNAIYLDNNWYHLDLTWDDPVTQSGKDLLIYEFFVIDDNKLKEKDTEEHNYNTYIYKEITTNTN